MDHGARIEPPAESLAQPPVKSVAESLALEDTLAEGALAKADARVAVFVSGEGSNLQALLDRHKLMPSWPCTIALVVSDKPWCRGVRRAREAGVPVFAAEPRAFVSKQVYEQAILAKLHEQGVDGIALAGYMRIVGSVLLQAYGGRIINLHPSILPAFPGKSAIADALDAGAKETGVTVHYIDEGVDTGPVIAQWRIPIPDGIDIDTLTERVHHIEHILYPVVVGEVALKWRSEGRSEVALRRALRSGARAEVESHEGKQSKTP